MRSLLAKTVVGSSLLLLGLTANAQYQPRDDYYGYQRGDDYRYQQAGRAVNLALDRLRADLDRAEANTVPFVSDFNGDRARIDRARQEVNEFQQTWSFGDFDARQWEDAIRAVQQVMNQNRLYDNNRGRLASDLNWMRNIEARFEQ